MVLDKLNGIAKHRDFQRLRLMETALIDLTAQENVNPELLQMAGKQYMEVLSSLDPRVLSSWFKGWEPSAVLGEMGIIIDEKPTYNPQLVSLEDLKNIPIGHTSQEWCGETDFPSTNRDSMYRNFS